MSVSKIRIQIPPQRPPAPGAELLADAIASGASWLHDAFLRWRERLRARIARRQELRARLAVLAMARRYEHSQPSFAKELFIACSRDDG